MLIQQSRAIIDFSNNIEMSSHWDKMKRIYGEPIVEFYIQKSSYHLTRPNSRDTGSERSSKVPRVIQHTLVPTPGCMPSLLFLFGGRRTEAEHIAPYYCS